MKNDPVNHPLHYTSDPSGIECIDVTRHRNFNIGNAIKYLWRAGLKMTLEITPKKTANINSGDKAQIEDLNKAVWYLVDEIHRLGGKCTVVTDSVNTCYPLDNDSIIEASSNYHEFINDKEYSIIGASNDLNITKENLRGALKKVLYNEYDKTFNTQKSLEFKKE